VPARHHLTPVRVVLAGLCAVAVVRGLGTLVGPVFGDEIPILWNVLHFAQERTLVPIQFNYPTFFSYLLAAWTGLVAGLRWLVSAQHPHDFAFGMAWSVGGSFERGVELAGLRLLPLAVVAGLVLATYRLGREAWGRDVGVGAAAVVVASATLAERAAWLVPDVLVALLVTVATTFCLRHLRRPPPAPGAPVPSRDLDLAAVLVGMAVATKYNGALAVLAITAACCLGVARRGGRPAQWVHPILRSGTRLGLITGVVFLACLPAVFAVPGEYWRMFRWEAQHVAEGQPLVALGELPYLWIALRLIEVEGLLGGFLLAALAGSVVLRRDPAAWVVALPGLAGLLVVGSWRYTSIHYLLWALPLAAVLGVETLRRAAGAVRAPPAAWPVVLALVLVPGTWRGVAESLQGLRTPANLVAAERWIEANIPAGSRVDQDWYAVPTIWNAAARDRHAGLLEQHPDALARRAVSVARKPVYVGNLGYPPDPPSVDQLRRDRPPWVVISSQTEPLQAEPLAGYGADHLRELHRRLYQYYQELRTGGGYRIAAEFREGAGPAVTVFRRTGGLD